MADQSKIAKYTKIAFKLKQDPTSVSNDDLEFFYSYTPEIDESRLDEINKEIESLKGKGEPVDPSLTAEGLLLSTQQILSSPDFKERTLKLAQDAQSNKTFNKISEGLNLLLAGSDVANSINQIAQSKQMASKNKRPSAPAIPQRDQYLQQALRQAQDGNYGVSQTLAPVQAEIADQYRADLQNAKTASTGQAGAFGSYAQLAANRRSRAALNLAPIANDVRMQNQQVYNDLLGKRQQETQNIFENSMASYPYDLQQYQLDQSAAAHLNQTGNENLRQSLTNLGTAVANPVAEMLAKRRYDRIRSKFDMYGQGDLAAKANRTLDENSGYRPAIGRYNNPQAWEMMHGL